jgi:hypothetical protein
MDPSSPCLKLALLSGSAALGRRPWGHHSVGGTIAFEPADTVVGGDPVGATPSHVVGVPWIVQESARPARPLRAFPRGHAEQEESVLPLRLHDALSARSLSSYAAASSSSSTARRSSAVARRGA